MHPSDSRTNRHNLFAIRRPQGVKREIAGRQPRRLQYWQAAFFGSDPIPSQGQWLRQVVTGFFAYHAVPTNVDALAAFRYHIMVLWMRTLTRRSQKDRTGWDRINRLAAQWLPKPRILHPWPNQRFAVKHPRWEPDAGMPHVRFCAGGVQ